MRSGLKAAVPFLSHPRFEVIPTDSVEDAVVKWVPREVTVTVTTSPRKGLEATLGLTERLSKHGYRVVPHVSARLVVDEVHLEEIVARLTGCGVVDIFVPAGDTDPPVGSFESALSLLVKLDALGRPFPQMGITGYPESHPAISDDLTVQAMWDKRHYATYIVSNLCFDAATVRRWIRRVRARGVALPLYFGLAGPVERTRLLNMAKKIGVGESARFLSGHAGWFLRMGAPGGYNPSRLLDRTGVALADPVSIVEGVHLFTFNQVRQTEEWRQSVLASLALETRSESATQQ
ncbi:MAG: methylenetetrahydrofolate reductase [Acidimicrobiales bacterium]|jgi:methylenetetrahydrofolate reductase (NADPH)